METLSLAVKRKRKELGLTQVDFANRSGLGLRFVRELERGKETVRMDKVKQALDFLSLRMEIVSDEE